MNSPVEMLASLVSGGASSRDWLWAIEPNAFQRHIATRQQMQKQHFVVEQTPEKMIATEGETAVIEVHGVMMKEPYYYDEISTALLQEAILLAAGSDQFRSIMLDVDSPGGSAAGLVQLAEAVAYARTQKPVIAQSTGMIASAAYFMSSQADKIFAARGDLIGSIGTRLMVFDWSQLFENIGIKAIPIDTGPLKSTGALGTELTEEQRQYLQTIVDGFQTEFTAAVRNGRGFDEEAFANVATGGVFHVGDARKLGLIDGIRTKSETLAAMPTRRFSQKGQQQMATEPEGPTAATLAELQENLPGASNDFIVAQLGAGATLQQATRAFLQQQAEERAELEKAKEEAEKKAVEAEQKAAQATTTTTTTKKRGNQLVIGDQEGATEGGPDYRAMAEEYRQKHKCSWAQACLAIKKQHPEAREFFKAPAA